MEWSFGGGPYEAWSSRVCKWPSRAISLAIRARDSRRCGCSVVGGRVRTRQPAAVVDGQTAYPYRQPGRLALMDKTAADPILVHSCDTLMLCVQAAVAAPSSRRSEVLVLVLVSAATSLIFMRLPLTF